jgi:hypothetical protein
MSSKRNGGDNAREAGENARSRGAREPRGDDQRLPPAGRKNFGFGELLKRQFRELMQSVTRRTFTPKGRTAGFCVALRTESQKVSWRNVYGRIASWGHRDAHTERTYPRV